MSAPVDVLAVMDAVLAFAARGVESDDPAREMIESGYEASAAVAELIEAGKVLNCNLPIPYDADVEYADSIDRFTAALARVRGAA